MDKLPLKKRMSLRDKFAGQGIPPPFVSPASSSDPSRSGPFIPKKRILENVIPDSTIRINRPNIEYKSAIYKPPTY